mmetsp:Transcript_34585/g.92005  ORF Transcript_34585/g.92005 Transcript_34585/m.92005 type:complete len:173 (+) Transcript_34585:105-623(+)
MAAAEAAAALGEAAMAEPAPWPPPEARPSPIWPWSARGTRRASEVFDFRVHELHAPSPYSGNLWMGDVSLSDVLGAQLVTYDRDLQPPNGAWDAPIQPKTVYVQYQGIDPVTQLSASVFVPAQLSLEVWADPNFQWTPQVTPPPMRGIRRLPRAAGGGGGGLRPCLSDGEGS